MSKSLEDAAWYCLNDQQEKDFPELDKGYYIGDLLFDIVDDPRIADAHLNLKKYIEIVGAEDWQKLLDKHRHEDKPATAVLA